MKTQNEMIWIDEHVDHNLHQWIAKCSACKIHTACVFSKVSADYQFCPHCGAKNKIEIREYKSWTKSK